MAKRISVKSVAARTKRANDALAKEMQQARADGRATADSFQNFIAGIGLNVGSNLTGSRYGFNPLSRNHVELEWAHRSSWICGVCTDLIADDMTRAGVDLLGKLEPSDIEKVEERATTLGVWARTNDTIKWARLYGGCIAFYMIEGQDPSTPLRIETVGKDMFRGLLVLDRWMVEPSLDNLVTEFGPDIGQPKFYRITADAPALPRIKIHHTRVMRLDGIRLPYYQKIQENMWGISVLERPWDRIISFDNATMGASQLVGKSFLRTLKLKGLRKAVAAGGEALQGIIAQVQAMRLFQSNESINLCDAEDEFNLDQSAGFAGIADIILRFGEQLSGSAGVPLVRLFGQSPTGFNSTGDSDLRLYYDNIKKEQNSNLKVPVTVIYRLVARSLGIKVPDGFGVEFRSLYQMSEKERAEVSEITVRTVDTALQSNIITKAVAVKELKQSSEETGIFSNITDEDIEEAEAEPPPSPDLEGLGGGSNAEEPPAPGAKPNPLASMPNIARHAGTGLPKLPMPAAPGSGDPGTGQDHRTAYDWLPLSQVSGLNVTIENPPGSVRRGVGADGKYWEVTMPCGYGYLNGTSSAEGPTEQMDCFVGGNPLSKKTWTIHQKDLATGAFDEHKVMLGFDTAKDAMDAYARSYSDGNGADRIMKVEERTADELKAWLLNHPYGKRSNAA